MLLITQFADADSSVSDTLNLPFETRQKARFKARLDSGDEVGIQLERGKILRASDKLLAADGRVIEVLAAVEAVSEVVSQDAHLLARICYHLGNRHVALQIEKTFCRYQHDHVLDEMVRLLGGDVYSKRAEFEPEAGAYSGSHEHHSHS